MTSTTTESDEDLMNRVQTACQNIGLTEQNTETAKLLYTQVYDNDLYHGRKLQTVLAGTIYVACRVNGVATSPTEIASEFECSRDDILDTARHLMKSLPIEVQPVSPQAYVADFATELDLSDSTQTVAKEMAELCVKQGLDSGKSPTGFAAGTLYAASQLTGENLTQEAISQVSDVSKVTIRNRYKSQLECYENHHAN